MGKTIDQICRELGMIEPKAVGEMLPAGALTALIPGQPHRRSSVGYRCFPSGHQSHSTGIMFPFLEIGSPAASDGRRIFSEGGMAQPLCLSCTAVGIAISRAVGGAEPLRIISGDQQ